MKIVQINCVRSSGSTGKIATQIHEYLAQNNVENYIIYGSTEKTTPNSYSVYSKWENHLHSFLSRKISLQGRASFIATEKAILYLKKQKPTLVHLHNLHGHYLNYEMLFGYLKKAQIPVVWTFHDCWPFTGKCAHYSAIGCKKWQTGCYDCGNLSTYPDSTYDGSKRDYAVKKRCFTSIDNLNIVCNSNWLKEQVKTSFFKNKSIRTIYNGLDISVFKPCSYDALYEKYSISREKNIVMGVSSVWKMQKGLQTFLDVAQELNDQFQIVMVGVDDNTKRILPANVISIKRTEDMQELAALYSMADVLLNASIEETFGMVTIEAMACGTPVIVSNMTACPEVVDQSTGLIVDIKDIQSIINAIYTIQKRGKSKYTENCVSKVKNNYTIEQMCKQYYELYKHLSDE